MIKRILPFVLVLAVLLSVMTVPASAAEASGSYVNLLDFVTANNTLNNTAVISNSGTVNFDLSSTLGSLRAYYFEVVFAFTGVAPNSYSLSFGSHALNSSVTLLGSGLVKISGHAEGLAQSKFSLAVKSSGTSYLTFLSFIVHTVPDNRTNIAATVTADPGTSATLSPGGHVMVQSSVTGSVQDATYKINITKSYWDNYDHIELRSQLYALGVQSVVAFTSTGDYLPLECSYLGDGNNSFGSWYYISCLIDITNIDPSYTGDIYIRVTALNNQTTGLYYVYGLQGVIFSEPVDSQMKWNQLIYKKIDSFLGTVRSFFNNFLDPALTSIYNNMTSGFSNVISKLGQLVTGSPVDEGVSDDMQQSENELGNMTDQMDELSPTIDVGDVNVNIDDYVDADSTAQVTNVLAVITNQPIIVSMLSILAGFALMGYVFFGKR